MLFIEVVKVFPHAADLFHPPGAGAQFSRKQQSDFFESAMGVEEGPTSLKIYWGLMLGSVSLLFTLSGGIDGIKMVKTFCGFPIMFMGLFMVYGFVKYMGKRPRDAYGNYLYEDAVADAPDSGEPMAKQSAVMRKLSKLFGIEIED